MAQNGKYVRHENKCKGGQKINCNEQIKSKEAVDPKQKTKIVEMREDQLSESGEGVRDCSSIDVHVRNGLHWPRLGHICIKRHTDKLNWTASKRAAGEQSSRQKSKKEKKEKE